MYIRKKHNDTKHNRSDYWITNQNFHFSRNPRDLLPSSGAGVEQAAGVGVVLESKVEEQPTPNLPVLMSKGPPVFLQVIAHNIHHPQP